MDRRLTEHGVCFVCGRENPHGIGVQWWVREDGTVYARVTFREAQQGPPGHAHGGALAAVLDEASEREGRKIYTEGRILLPDGTVTTTAQGLFIEAPHMFPPDIPLRWQPVDT